MRHLSIVLQTEPLDKLISPAIDFRFSCIALFAERANFTIKAVQCLLPLLHLLNGFGDGGPSQPASQFAKSVEFLL